MNTRVVRMSIVVLILAGIATFGIGWRLSANSPVLLSEEEVVQSVIAQYPGEVVHTSLENDAYVIQIQLVKGLYELRVDADKGEITSIERLEAVVSDETIPEEQPTQQPEVIEPTKDPIPGTDKGIRTLVTREEAIAVSLKQVQGIVREMEFKDKDGNGYYLVEIETDDGREVVVEVSGISGVIRSMTWDDNDSQESDNEDDESDQDNEEHEDN